MPKDKQPAGSINEKALDLQTGLQNSLLASTELYKKLNVEAGNYGAALVDTISQTTKLNRIIEENKDLIGKIGTQIIKNITYTNQVEKLSRAIKNIESKRRVLIESQTKEESALGKVLADQEEKLVKINETLNKQEAQKLNAIQLQEEALIKTEALKKKNQLTDYQRDRLESKYLKALGQQYHLEDKIKESRESQEKVSKKIQAISGLTNISTKKLYDEQIDAGKESLKNLREQDKVIAQGNKKVRRGNFHKELANKLGLTHIADFAKHKETFGLGGAATLVTVGLIAAAIGGILKMMFTADNQITDIAKQLGISKDGAQLLRDQFVRASKESQTLNGNLSQAVLSIENQVNAMNEMNAQLGIAGVYSEKQIQDQIVLTKQMGLTGDEAADLQKYALINNKTAEDTANIISEQTVAFRKQTGVMLDGRKVLADVAKVEGQLAVQYKNNPGLIAQAVLQAKKFGLTLEEARTSASSLLDFESSISNELEAELLTGKQYNFERARALALAGKSAEAATELVKQVGTLAQFQKLNVIQQNAMAKAIGLSSDELSNALVKQQLLQSVSISTRDAYNEQLKIAKQQNREAEFLAGTKNATNGAELNAQLAQISAQMKFEEGLNRIKEAFGNMFTEAFIKKLQNLAEVFANALPGIVKAISWLGGAANAVSGIFGGGDTDEVHDSMINPKGRVVISTPQGAIVPDKQDSIVTTTNPGGLIGGGSGDNDKLAAKLDKVIELLSKGGHVYMDSKKVGTTQGLAYSSWG